MMFIRSLMIASIFCFSVVSTLAMGRVIYGQDNRMDYFSSDNSFYKELSESTVAIIEKRSVRIRKKTAKIYTKKYGHALNLCPSEPFYDQEIAAHCSGFLVGPKTIVTAGHCVMDKSMCKQSSFVFGYRMNTKDQKNFEVPKEDVYNCKRLVKSVLNEDGVDYAVVELDRKVLGRKPLEFRREGMVSEDDELVIMGYPMGLPLKIADDAFIRDNNNEFYFSANLDSYQSNSGSAVFNAATGVIEGILVRGEDDYRYAKGKTCNISNVCKEGKCRGEDVVRITQVKEIQ